jgi:LL-diaminopimelate aminotransferase
MEVGCETHSLSKTFNMAGWRVGFLVGNEKIVKALGEIKTNIDSGVFNACQEAAIVALNQYEPFTSSMRATYQERRDILLPAVRAAGLETQTPAASFYIWSHVPAGMSSSEYVMKLIKEKGIVTLPGDGFGQAGSGYVRFSLCQDVVTLKKVAELLKS